MTDIIQGYCMTPLTPFRIDLAINLVLQRFQCWGTDCIHHGSCAAVANDLYYSPCVSSQGEEDGGRRPAEAAAVGDRTHCENV